MPSNNLAQLEVIDISKAFGGIRALDSVSAGFEKGQVTCIIGPNGAGKTTLFNIVSGFIGADNGDVFYRGVSLRGLRPHCVARLGIGRLFQDVRVFPRMTLLENVAVACKGQKGESPLAAMFWPVFGGQDEVDNLHQAHSHLEFVGLGELANSWAERISYGQQKLLAIARLLNNDADCLMLDEPTAGVQPSLVDKIIDLIRRLADTGKTIIVIEHNLGIVKRLGDWIYLMEDGRIEAFGEPGEVLRDAALVRLFPSL